uniref:Uncharacterized protein n=1 Tax=Oryza nivara TaxID=4536 RepID=A0A0E0HP10_ORYNI
MSKGIAVVEPTNGRPRLSPKISIQHHTTNPNNNRCRCQTTTLSLQPPSLVHHPKIQADSGGYHPPLHKVVASTLHLKLPMARTGDPAIGGEKLHEEDIGRQVQETAILHYIELVASTLHLKLPTTRTGDPSIGGEELHEEDIGR